MKVSKFYFPLLAAAMLASCSSEAIDGPNSPVISEKDGVNMKITISLPTSNGTRAAGDPAGEEIGKDFENNVKEVLIVFASKDDNNKDNNNSFIASNVVSIQPTAEGVTIPSNYDITATFNKSVLVNYIESLGTKPDQAHVNVYAFCNPTQELKDHIANRNRGESAANWMNAKNVLTGDNLQLATVSEGKNIPMANLKVTDLALPPLDGIKNGAYAESAYPMGTVDVIRSIARFDFKTVNNNVYPIDINVVGEDKAIEGGLQIELTNMALVNMSNSYYYLHRLSATGHSSEFESTSLMCGEDDRNKFFIDPDWDWKANSNWTKKLTYSDHFQYALFTDATPSEDGKLGVDLWRRIILKDYFGDGAISDNDNEWNLDPDNNKGDYKIWRYVTENTIPEPASKQKVAISTGVVFRGEIKPTESTPEKLKAALEAKAEPIFIYKNNIYPNWKAVEDEATKEGNENTALASAYKACKGKTGEELYQAAVNNQFTIYRYNEQKGGWATNYYYWNRHWDNGKPGVMGNMEFAVVRNNVYKLAVTSISALGHPLDPKDDPDPVDPDDPDEKSDVKIKVDVQVKKWTVRKNDIEF